jgi:hypothetical protein
MKKIEAIHLDSAETDTPKEAAGEPDLDGEDDDDDDDERLLDTAQLADADGEPKEAPADLSAGGKSSTIDVTDKDSAKLPESRSASSTASKSARRSTDKAGENTAPSKPAGPVVVVTMPGFHVFSDGSSRVYVRVSGRAKIVEKKDEGKLRYHLRGVTVPERVNRMALPTGHFGTPVAKAFVAQVEGGADLVIVLRETVKGVVRLKKRGRGLILSVDFPKQRKKAEQEKDPLADAG